MMQQSPLPYDNPEELQGAVVELDQESEDDLWFLPGPMDEESDYVPPGQSAEQFETSIIADWTKAEAAVAARLARVAGRLGALDERLQRGPEGWRHRLALIEAADLSWFVGDRVGPDRLALWIALRLSGAQEDTSALARVGWAVRRLTGGPGPEVSLANFLDRRNPQNIVDDTERFSDRADSWLDLMTSARHLHPITQACLGYHIWALAGLSQHGDRIEAAVTAGRIAAVEAKGAVFAPVAMGGAGGLRARGVPRERLDQWLNGMDSACLTAMRHLDDIEAWATRSETVMAVLSGRTPLALRKALTEWPLLSAPMAEVLSGASRAAVQRNLAWMESRGLIREVTGQARFRMWRISTTGSGRV